LVVLLLGFDTATPAVTVALHDGEQVLAQLVTVDAHRHAELLAPAIAKVIADVGAERGDVTGIAVGVGPGPYTGLRVGLVTARVLGATLGIPAYGVCTLDVIAAGAVTGGTTGGGEFLVTTDARRREVYWARYDGTGQRLAGPAVARPDQIDGRDMPVAGEGARLHPDVLPRGREPRYPDAGSLCGVVAGSLVTGAGLLPPEPLYLRRPDAREPGAPKRVSPVAESA
jgi:tRNA threonylcarbamoyladenosine biosynthesis protein TsaB